MLGAVRRRCAPATLPKGVVWAIVEAKDLPSLDWLERFDNNVLVAPVHDKGTGVRSCTMRAMVVNESRDVTARLCVYIHAGRPGAHNVQAAGRLLLLFLNLATRVLLDYSH